MSTPLVRGCIVAWPLFYYSIYLYRNVGLKSKTPYTAPESYDGAAPKAFFKTAILSGEHGSKSSQMYYYYKYTKALFGRSDKTVG